MMNEQFIFEAEPFEVDSEGQGMSRSRRWIRRGGTIVVLPDARPIPEDNQIYEMFAGSVPSRKDLINERIDFHAQEALYRMFKGDPGARADAAQMFAAVKAGRLAGIYIVDQLVPAKRAERMGLGWWQLIPKGEDAILLWDPIRPMAGPPLIAFRDQVKSLPSRLDPALRKAWATHRLAHSAESVRCDLLSRGGQALTETEFGGIGPAVPVANIVPQIRLCKLRQKPVARPPRDAAPVLVEATGEFLAHPLEPLVEGFFCPRVNQGAFIWLVSVKLRFPKGTEDRIWRVGFVQNMISEEFEAVYAGAPPKKYQITQPHVDFNEEDAASPGMVSTIPFIATQRDILKDRKTGEIPQSPKTGRVLQGSNPIFFMPGSTPTVETFDLLYLDALSFSLDLRLNGDKNQQLISVKRFVKFRTFLVSLLTQFVSGRVVKSVRVLKTVVHAVSTDINVQTSLRVGSDNVPSGTTDVGNPVPKLLVRSVPVPVLDGVTANAVARQKLLSLGIHTSPFCRPGGAREPPR